MKQVKLCVCLGSDWPYLWPDYVGKVDLVELRIDQMFVQKWAPQTAVADLDFFAAALGPVCMAAAGKWIFTCRDGFLDETEQAALLTKLLPQTPAYIDIACDSLSLTQEQQALADRAKAQGIGLIFSLHRFDEVPEIQTLYSFTNLAFALGADLVKAVCYCRDASGEARLLSLYRDREHLGRIISFGMGPYSLSSRLHAAALGAPIIYLAPDQGAETAPGQPRYTQFKEHLVNIL